VAAMTLGVIQTDAATDAAAAFASLPARRRYLLRPPALAGAVPDGAELLAWDEDDRGAAAACLRAAGAAGPIVVLRADERASAELAAALAGIEVEEGAGRFRARVALRFLGREVSGAPAVIAWAGDPAARGAARDLAGTLLRDVGALHEAIADLERAAVRAASRRRAVGAGDFLWRPAAALARRLGMRAGDGVPGLILSVLETYGEVLAAAKVWERTRAAPVHPVPEGFDWVETPRGLIVTRAGASPELVRILLTATPEAVAGTPLVGAGRGATWALRLEDGVEAVLRWYRRGGLPRLVADDRFVAFGGLRPLRELAVTEEARRRGLAVPEVLGARVDRVGPALYRGAIVTRRIGGVVSLAELARGSDRRRRLAALGAVGAALRRMHDQGLHHRDLNAGNLLLRPQGDGFAVTIIDLDRARLMASVPAGRRRAALARLARSLAKERDGRILDAAERAALVDAYGAA